MLDLIVFLVCKMGTMSASIPGATMKIKLANICKTFNIVSGIDQAVKRCFFN